MKTMLLLQIPLIIPFLLFMAVYKGFELRVLNWVVAAILVAIGPFFITNVIIPTVVYWRILPLEEIFLPLAIPTLVAQLSIALVLFRYLEKERDDSITGWVVAAIFGFVLLYVFAPFAIGQLL